MTRTIFMTGSSIYWETDADGDPVGDGIDAHGWIQPGWSRTELYDDRDDVAPLWTDADIDEDTTVVESAIGAIVDALGYPETNSAPTFYGQDDYSPMDSDVNYSYAVHLDGFTDAELSAIVTRFARKA
jgi:hypothetical protein